MSAGTVLAYWKPYDMITQTDKPIICREVAVSAAALHREKQPYLAGRIIHIHVLQSWQVENLKVQSIEIYCWRDEYEQLSL